jgi:hypothetical protein
MDSRSPEIDALLRITSALVVSIERAIDRLLSLLPTASRALAIAPEPEPGPDRAEDIAIQQALDKVLKYHRTHPIGQRIPLRTISQNKRSGK